MKREDFDYSTRYLLHFDLPVGVERAWVLASNPASVARHSFYPLIGYSVTSQRFRRDDQGNKIRDEKKRDIKVCAHADTAIYGYYGQLLSEAYEKRLARDGLGDVVTAFRSKGTMGTNVDCAAEVFEFIRTNRPCIAFAFDISKFFDRLDHVLLKSHWADLLGQARLPADHFAVYRSLTNFCWVERDRLYEQLGISKHNPRHVAGGTRRRRLCTPEEFRNHVRGVGLLCANPESDLKRGIPQGSPMSAVLSNIYMLDFDRQMAALALEKGGLYRRYCDDIILIIPEAQAQGVVDAVEAAAAEAKVDLHPEKRHEVHFSSETNAKADETLQYLGFTFDGERVLLRLSSLDRYYSKMRAGVSLARQTQRKYNRREQAQGLPLTPLRLKKLYRLYSYLHQRRREPDPDREAKTIGNFLTYVYKAADKLDSQAIRDQVRAHWKKLRQEIEKPIKNQLRGP